MWGKEKIQRIDYKKLINYRFSSGIIDKYSKNQEVGRVII
jgi:hypothetical protein